MTDNRKDTPVDGENNKTNAAGGQSAGGEKPDAEKRVADENATDGVNTESEKINREIEEELSRELESAGRIPIDEFAPLPPDVIAEDIKQLEQESGDGSVSLWKRFVAWEYSFLFLAFLIPAALMFTVYAVMQVHPFGQSSVLVLDLNAQYVYFFDALRKCVFGESSFLYSFSRALGGEFMGIYAYYLASPLSYIVALFPAENILGALYTMFVIKCGLCGTTFAFFVRKTRTSCTKASAVLFGIMYALCSYAIIYQHNTMWIDNLILLPLVALGIEQVVKFRKFKLFVFSLALSVLSSFYIGYMVCIFCLLYFLYYFFASSANGENNPLGEDTHFVRAALRMALFSAVALGIAAIIIFPTQYSLSFGKDTFSNPNFSPSQKFNFLDLISKFFISSYDTVRPEGWPLVYCGILAIMLVPIYFISKHTKPREKIFGAIFIALFFISFNLSTLDLVWHGFQTPNWLNYRYSFMLVFFLLVIACRAFEHFREISGRHLLLICSLYSLVLFLLQKFDYDDAPDFECIWASLALMLAYGIALYTSKRASSMTAQTIIIAIIVCAEVFGASVQSLVKLNSDVVISSYASYHNNIDKYQPSVDNILSTDKSFYRFEKTDHAKVNDNFALGIRGFTNSTSTLNKSTIDFLRYLGLSSKSHWSKYYGGTPVFDSLMSMKYLIAAQDYKVSNLYENIHREYDENGDMLTTYKNPYALSLAYGVSEKIKNLSFVKPDDYDEGLDEGRYDEFEIFYSPFERMNAMVSAMLDDDIEVFMPSQKPDISYDNADIAYTSGHTRVMAQNSDADASMIYSLSVTSDAQLFCYFPSEYPREVKLTLNGVSFGTFNANETSRILTLGNFEIGDIVRMTLTLSDDKYYVRTDDPCFYYLDEYEFDNAMDRLSACQYEITQWNDDSFTGTIKVDEGAESIFTSLPYDEGWKIYIDGEKVEIYENLNALVGFDASVGVHELKMEYRPDCIYIGGTISIISLVIFAAMIAGEFVYNRKRKKQLLQSENSCGHTDENQCGEDKDGDSQSENPCGNADEKTDGNSENKPQ